MGGQPAPEDGVRRILVFRSANPPFASQVVRYLRTRFEGAEVRVLLPAGHVQFFRDDARPDHFCVYDTSTEGVFPTALTILSSLRKQRFDLVVIPASDGPALADLRCEILLSRLLRARRRIVINERLEPTTLSLWRQLSVVADWAMSLAALAIAVPATRAILALYPPHAASPDTRRLPRGSKRRVAILVPILPDLSHTFVYREVLGMKASGGEFSLIALERGDPSVIHPEAEALLRTAIFLPALSPTRYLLLYLSFLIRSPRRMARLLHLYMPACQGDALAFLRLGQYRNICHPMRALAVAKCLKRLKVTHIHAHGSTYPATRAMVSSALLNASFSFSTFVDFDYPSDFKMLHEKLRRAEFVIATTQFCRDRLLSLTSEAQRSKIHTIYLSIDPDYGKDVPPPPPGAAPKVLSVCRFVEKKGLEYLLEALAILKQEGETPRCLLIGDGPERQNLMKMAEELHLNGSVEFTGPISNEKVRSLMHPANILVAPSVYAGDGERDGIPTVLVEAMACGMPVVSTSVSGIPELVVNDDSGLLVPERDAAALAKAMKRLLRDPQLRKSLGRRGKEKILSDFNIHDSSARLWSLVWHAAQPCGGEPPGLARG